MDLATEFPLRDDIVYLNHAAVAPWPARTRDAVSRFAAENTRQGALDYPEWLVTERHLRQNLQALINAPDVDDIALVKNTSEALSFVAWGLPWKPGDSVVISDQEFPSNRIVWESLAARGVTVRAAALNDGPTPEDALFAQVDDSTRLIAISSVQYATGLRMDLARIGDFCHSRGILFCVDAIQSLGALRFDVQAIGADFVAADGHKWLLGPEGLGLFYCVPKWREQLTLFEYGWHMVDKAGDFDAKAWQPAASARRFECGSPNMLGAYALDASLSLLHEAGLTNVQSELLERTGFLIERLEALPAIQLISDNTPSRRSGIVTFRSRNEPDSVLFDRLWKAGIVCARRGGGVRFSPHFYTAKTELERALALVSGE